MMRTSNPVLNENVFAQTRADGGSETMSIQGTVNKSFFLLLLLAISAGWVWNKFWQPGQIFEEQVMSARAALIPFVMGGAIVGFVFALATCFVKKWAMVTAPIYAIAEGLFLGGFSALMELTYPGIVVQAVGLTFGTLFSLLLAYKSGLIKVSQNFRLGVFAATGAIALFYFVSMILGFFNIQVPMIHQSGPIGIGFSLFVVGIAALNLVLDFDFIEHGAQSGAPKYMEWYGAFGLLVTLIWLYLEILRLLAKLRDRR